MAFTKKELEKLAELGRLDVPDSELKVLQKNLDDIVTFISKLKQAPGELQIISAENENGDSAGLKNVLREDENPHKEAEYSETFLKEAPQKERGFVKVKKVFDNDED
ncbi:MAG: aspartyl/glutamyl-tRNA amidotransferase subunit C [Candidatus Pacebacteria bacterium]|nr:aspartyl/glutamyl-tRNA amidotransferase subunit C [Candidatus Paceibacterota bacterium]